MKLALPAWLTIGVLPFIYVLSLYTVYEGALRGVNWACAFYLFIRAHQT